MKKYFFFFFTLVILSQISYSQTFTEQTGISILGVLNSSVAWGDYDNDEDLDVLLSGYSSSNNIAKVYKNNGNNTLSDQIGIILSNVKNSSSSWGDYDNDGDLDLLLTGTTSYNYTNAVSKIYKNNGNNTFTEQNGINLAPIEEGSVAWCDFDNDGKLDIILSGKHISGQNVSLIYRNNGNNNFSLINGTNLSGVFLSSIAVCDYDNDGYRDIIITGSTSNALSNPISKIYKNYGNFTFVEQIGINLTGVCGGSVAWGDYNNDGFADILLTGYDTSFNGISKIYKNIGNGTFSEQIGINLVGVSWSSAVWGDCDNDGDLDILISGFAGTIRISKIYINDGNNSFYELIGNNLISVKNGSIRLCDYNNDTKLDIIISGDQSDSYPYATTRIYKNSGINSNTPPSIPLGLNYQILSDTIIKLFWNRSIDNNTSSNSIRYNIRIGTSQNGVEICSPQSDLVTGFHRIPEMGFIQDTFFILKVPSISSSCPKYNVSVQAIDNGFLASVFSSNIDIITNLLNINPNFSSNQTTFTAPPFVTQFTNNTPNINDYDFVWDFGDTTTLASNNQTVNHNYNYNGQYSVSLKATLKNSNCSDSIFKQNYINCNGLGIQNTESNFNFSLFPNPSSGEFTILVDGLTSKEYTIQISSLVGSLLYSENVQANGQESSKKLDLSNLSKGIYFVSIVSENKKSVKKLVIQ